MCWQDVSPGVGTSLERKREPTCPPTSHEGPWHHVLEHVQHRGHNRFFQKTHEAGTQTESSAAIPLLEERSANLSVNVQLALFIIPKESQQCRRPSTDEWINKGWHFHTIN